MGSRKCLEACSQARAGSKRHSSSHGQGIGGNFRKLRPVKSMTYKIPPNPPFTKGGSRKWLYTPFSKGGWGAFPGPEAPKLAHIPGNETVPLCPRGSGGYTVLEIVAVLFIFLVALAIGFYSMGDWRGQNRFHGVVGGFKQAVTLTRARAIARQKPVILQMVKPYARSNWKHSENYLIQERTAGDGKKPTDTNPSADKQYWLEFLFVDEKTSTGGSDYLFFLNAVPIDSTLNYANMDPNSRGQVCFNARGYNISPVSGGAPMSLQADFQTNALKRHLSVTISPLGEISTRPWNMP
jgi:Tfp pilus assembly protein FimT